MSTATDTKQAEATGKDLVLVREFAAPRDLVWQVWTDAKHMENWWGPKGFDTKVTTFDFRVGGKMKYVMVGPDGLEYPGYGVFSEIVPPEKLVTTDEFGEDHPELMPGVDLPKGMVMTAAFDDLGTKTRLTLTISHATVEDRKRHEEMGVVEGWGSSFEKMDEYLAELQK